MTQRVTGEEVESELTSGEQQFGDLDTHTVHLVGAQCVHMKLL